MLRTCQSFRNLISEIRILKVLMLVVLNETLRGNFELCVQVGGQVQHWFRNNQTGNWYFTTSFASNVKTVAAIVESSSSFYLEVILLLNNGQLQHYWRDSYGSWNAGPIIGSYL